MLLSYPIDYIKSGLLMLQLGLTVWFLHLFYVLVHWPKVAASAQA